LPIVVAFDIGRHQFTQLDSLERPAMGARHSFQFAARLGHTDVERGFRPITSGQDKLHSQRGLSGTWPAFDQVESATNKTATENIV
jgi:hypothetical protein